MGIFRTKKKAGRIRLFYHNGKVIYLLNFSLISLRALPDFTQPICALL